MAVDPDEGPHHIFPKEVSFGQMPPDAYHKKLYQRWTFANAKTFFAKDPFSGYVCGPNVHNEWFIVVSI